MSKLCRSVSATEPNSTLCKLQSRVDILEVGSPNQKSYKRVRYNLSFNRLKAYVRISRSANVSNVSMYAGRNVLTHVAKMFL